MVMTFIFDVMISKKLIKICHISINPYNFFEFQLPMKIHSIFGIKNFYLNHGIMESWNDGILGF